MSDYLALLPVTDRYDFDGEEADRLLPAIRALPRVMERALTAKQRQAVRLRYLEGLPQVEVSRIMGVAPSVVSRHLAAARKKMKRAMEGLL